MLVSAYDHYRLHESLAATSSDVRAFIDEVKKTASERDCDVFWRGQADHTWPITTSLARVTNVATALTDTDLNRAEADLLQEAKRWVTRPQVRPKNDLEWLALLQHNQIPTRILDFSRDPLIATFFATETLDDIEGRLFAILVPRGGHRVLDVDADAFEIGHIPAKEIRLWEPRPEISPRLAAQQGVFVLGKLPSTSVARFVWDSGLEKERLMVRSEVVSTMSLPLYFQRLGITARAASDATRCYTLRIHVDKASIREQLTLRSRRGSLRPAKGAIDYAYCYPDTHGMEKYSPTLKRVRRGLA